jgi:hypothetical protein
MANQSIKAAFERMWQHITIKLGDKVDREAGKGLSTNDYTTEEKENLNNLKELVGDTAVATQISNAVEQKSQVQIIVWEENE